MMRLADRRCWLRERNPAWWFLAPALGLMVVFFVLPVIAGLVLSFTDFDLYALGDLRRLRIVQLGNYLDLMQDALFWQALKNTLYFTLIGGPLTIVVALAAALAVNSKLTPCKRWFRSALFLPVVTTLVAVAVVWRYLYHPRFGLVNYLLTSLGLGPIDFLGDPLWAMPAIILMALWKNFGFGMMVFIAGLNAIPQRLYEAATLDGADDWQQFRRITLPMLQPTFVFVGLITAIGYLQLFAEPYVMTQGGPANSTLSLALYMYQQGFRWWNLGYAAAVAFVLFAAIAGIGAAQLRRRKGNP